MTYDTGGGLPLLLSSSSSNMSAENDGTQPNIVPFSELGTPPESPWVWWRAFGLLYIIFMTALSLVILVPLLPCILLLTLYRRYIFRCPQYHTQPKALRVAVIGGGWSGLQCMSRLKALGVEHVTGYERYDAFGGTWHPKLRYHSIQIHGAMWITSFSKYPYSKVADDQNGKVSGEEVEDYVIRFADDKGLNENYKLNSRVVHLKYESEARTAMLVIEAREKKDPLISSFTHRRLLSPAFQIFQDRSHLVARFFIASNLRKINLMRFCAMRRKLSWLAVRRQGLISHFVSSVVDTRRSTGYTVHHTSFGNMS